MTQGEAPQDMAPIDQAPQGALLKTFIYGENPYMTPAGLYTTGGDYPLAFSKYKQIEGNPVGLVGYTDFTWLTQIITHVAAGFALNFGQIPYIAVAVKHGNACGLAVGGNKAEVIHKMATGNELSLFGGVVMTNFALTDQLARVLTTATSSQFVRRFDGIYAPSVSKAALARVTRTTGKCRVFVNPALGKLSADSLDTTPRRIQGPGGEYALQPNYTFVLNIHKSKSYGGTAFYEHLIDMVLGWAVGCVSNSNTIALVRDGQLLALAVGQKDRVGAAELAIEIATKAGHDLAGAVAYSDSFFPYEDGPEVLAKAGIKMLFSSAGADREAKVIEAYTALGGTMLLQPDKEVRGFSKH